MRRLSLRKSLIAIFIFSSVIPILVIGFYTYHRQKINTNNMELSKLENAATLAEILVSTKIEQYKKPLKVLNNQPTDKLSQLQESGKSFAAEILSLYDGFSGFAFYDSDGKELYSIGYSKKNTGIQSSLTEKLLPNDIICLKLPETQGRFALICRNQNNRITLGILQQTFFISAIKMISFNHSGHVFLVDQKGKVIVHPNLSMNDKQLNSDYPLRKFSSKQLVVYDNHSNQKKMIAIGRRLKSDINTAGRWYIVATQEYDEVYANIYGVWESIALIAISILLLLLPIATYISRKINAPLLRMVRHISSVSMGDLQILPATSNYSEIRELENSYNTMITEFKRIRASRNTFKKEIILRNKFEQNLLRAKVAAEDASKAKDEFIANVSHEIRTPLNAVIGFSEKAIRTVEDPDLLSDLKTINNEAEHLLLLINDLLDNAKIEAGKLDLEYMPFDLHAHLKTICAPFMAQARNKDIYFELDIGDTVPQYTILDPLRLRQILSNLLSNALKFTSAGKVTLKVETQSKDKNYATTRFMVIDTGIGIPKEKQNLIFEKFTQADGSTTRKYGGTGLGTTISKKLVTLLGGRMGIRSVVGQGSTFWFDLILDINIQQEQIESIKTEAIGLQADFTNTFHGNILVAEDYNINQILIRSQLEYLGLSVMIAGNGKSAIEECKNMNYDMILMDLQMPEMGGVEATRYIRKEISEYKDIPILALTANADKDVRNTCRSVGMTDVLTKPTHIEDLVAAIAKWCPQLSTTNTPASDQSAKENNDKSNQAIAEKESLWNYPDTNNTISHKQTTDSLMHEKPLDIDQALLLFGGNKMIVDMSINAFRNSITSHLLPELKKSMNNGELEEVGRLAHKIKGGASSIAATALADIAGQLETAAKNSNRKQSEDMVVTLEEKVKELTIFISNL